MQIILILSYLKDDPIWENLTLREHLHIYALAHGVTKKSLNPTIDRLFKIITAKIVVKH